MFLRPLLVLPAILALLAGASSSVAGALAGNVDQVERLCPNAAAHQLQAVPGSESAGMRRALGRIGALPPAGHLPNGLLTELHGEVVTYDPTGIRTQRLSPTETLYLVPAREASASVTPACQEAVARLPSVALRRALRADWRLLGIEVGNQAAECAVGIVGGIPMELGCETYPARYPSVLNDIDGRLLQIAPRRITRVTLRFSHRADVVLRRTVPGILISRHQLFLPPVVPTTMIRTLADTQQAVRARMPTQIVWSAGARTVRKIPRPPDLIGPLSTYTYYINQTLNRAVARERRTTASRRRRAHEQPRTAR